MNRLGDKAWSFKNQIGAPGCFGDRFLQTRVGSVFIDKMKLRRFIGSHCSILRYTLYNRRALSLFEFEENKVNVGLGSTQYGFDSSSEVQTVLITSCSLLAVMW